MTIIDQRSLAMFL